MNRKDVDIFLIELDNFISKYKLEHEVVIFTFITIFKANILNIKNTANKIEYINLPILEKYINIYGTCYKKRTSVFVRKIAYGLTYKYVNDFSYEDIFFKILNKEYPDIFKPSRVIKKHGKKIHNPLLIPEDWYHTNDIFIF